VVAGGKRDDAFVLLGRVATALRAPRNLKAPILWKFSHLKCTLAPVSESMVLEVSTGVRFAKGLMRSCAAATSA
jgi:hypothetical protein